MQHVPPVFPAAQDDLQRTAARTLQQHLPHVAQQQGRVNKTLLFFHKLLDYQLMRAHLENAQSAQRTHHTNMTSHSVASQKQILQWSHTTNQLATEINGAISSRQIDAHLFAELLSFFGLSKPNPLKQLSLEDGEQQAWKPLIQRQEVDEKVKLNILMDPLLLGDKQAPVQLLHNYVKKIQLLDFDVTHGKTFAEVKQDILEMMDNKLHKKHKFLTQGYLNPFPEPVTALKPLSKWDNAELLHIYFDLQLLEQHSTGAKSEMQKLQMIDEILRVLASKHSSIGASMKDETAYENEIEHNQQLQMKRSELSRFHLFELYLKQEHPHLYRPNEPLSTNSKSPNQLQIHRLLIPFPNSLTYCQLGEEDFTMFNCLKTL